MRAGVHERVVRGIHGGKRRRVFERDNITYEQDMGDALTRTQQYRHEQCQRQDKLPKS